MKAQEIFERKDCHQVELSYTLGKNTPMSDYSLSSYTYELPPELIAQEAIHPHHDARLMVYNKDESSIEFA